jgi:formyltetrahydrofolate-dependent phosphoribosylglycinamide formyltransferase
MLDKLKQRWKVSGTNLVLIICTFALGGSLCGYTGRKILSLISLEKGVAWLLIYILLMTLIWPMCVLVISIPLGQFSFFKKYLQKMGSRMIGNAGANATKNSMCRVAIFASGAGSNAQKIITHFKNSASVHIALVVCNKVGAGVIHLAENENIPVLLINKKQFAEGDGYLPALKSQQIDFIVLAGFLWKIPASILQAYPEKIVNIHPALLPKYGGMGMYGHRVHDAVIAAREKESGITIHYADELYDHGKIIFQASCLIAEDDTPAALAAKIHLLEHHHYPLVLERLLQNKKHR